MDFPVGGHGAAFRWWKTPRCVAVKWVLAATVSPSATSSSTWYRKSGKAVSHAVTATLHDSWVSCPQVCKISGPMHSSMNVKSPLFHSSSKYLRTIALFSSADMTHLPRGLICYGHRVAEHRESRRNGKTPSPLTGTSPVA